MSTKLLAIIEYLSVIARQECYARQALLRMKDAKSGDRVRKGVGGPERADSYFWRKCKRHMRKAAKARKALVAVSQ